MFERKLTPKQVARIRGAMQDTSDWLKRVRGASARARAALSPNANEICHQIEILLMALDRAAKDKDASSAAAFLEDINCCIARLFERSWQR